MHRTKSGAPRMAVSAVILAFMLVASAAFAATPPPVPERTPGATSSAASGERTSSGSVSHRVLPNGLESFVMADATVPLATICVAFRGGSAAQDPETAGLFHLYEHMMFAGNERYPTQAAFTAALNAMGAAEWNGATGSEYIYYYITLPSGRLERGIEFWAHALIRPVFDQAKLEREKSVVVNEIRGYHADPRSIFSNSLDSRIFPEYPWRKNIDGPVENILAATPELLESIRKSYYIPRNTAVMIGGDVDPETAHSLVARWFGDWAGGPRPDFGDPPHGAFPGGIRIAYEDPNFYPGIAQVQYAWRGPDVLRRTGDTYTADVLLFLLTSPVGRFKTRLMELGPGLYDPEYISFNYPTSRDGGAFDFTTFLLLGAPGSGPAPVERTEALRSLIEDEFTSIAGDPEAYFGEAELRRAKAKLIDQNLLAMEVTSSFVTGTLVFWWAVATTDYFFSYEEHCSKVTFGDIAELVRRYLIGTPVASAIRVRAGTRVAAPDGTGPVYERVDGDNAFWWQR